MNRKESKAGAANSLGRCVAPAPCRDTAAPGSGAAGAVVSGICWPSQALGKLEC